jgi:hypothetical protein
MRTRAVLRHKYIVYFVNLKPGSTEELLGFRMFKPPAKQLEILRFGDSSLP